MKVKWLLSKLSKQLKMPFLKTKQNCVNPITSIPYTICHKADKGKRNLILGGKPFLKKKFSQAPCHQIEEKTII
jgi:hypothetical protein